MKSSLNALRLPLRDRIYAGRGLNRVKSERCNRFRWLASE
jgi:hypothetical protein